MQKQTKFRRLVRLEASEDGSAPKEIQILMPGVWDTPYQGAFAVTLEDISEAVMNFDAGVRKGVPVNVEHGTDIVYGGKAVGWISRLIDRGMEGLWAVIDWTQEGIDLITSGAYAFVSPEYDFYFWDPETGREYENVLTGCAVTNKPLFKDLRAIMASDSHGRHDVANVLYVTAKEETMNVQELLTKDPAALTEDERQYLQAHLSEVSAENRIKFSLTAPVVTPAEPVVETPVVETPVANVTEETTKTEETVVETPAEPVVTPVETPVVNVTEETPAAETAASVNASEETVTIKASELAEMRSAQTLLAAEQQKVRRIEATDKVKSYLFNEKGGKFVPALEGELVDFYLTLSPTQVKAFDGIVSKMPESKLFAPMGVETPAGAEDETGSATDRFVALATAAVKASEGTLSIDRAMENLQTEKPEAYDAYIKERESQMGYSTPDEA